MKRDLLIYVGGVILAAVAALALITPQLAWQDHDRYLLWLGFCVLAEYLWLPSITGKGSHSMVSMFNFVVIALLPLAAAVWIVSLAALIASFLFQKRAWYRSLFNGAQMVLTTLMASGVFLLLGGDLSQLTHVLDLRRLLIWVISAVVYHGINTGLVAGAIALQNGQRWTETWHENFGYRDELMSSAALFLMSPIALAVYLALGFWGLILFFVPLLFIRDAHSRHIELVRAQDERVRTASMVARVEMAGHIAHNLGNMLTPVMSRAQMLMLGANRMDPDKVAQNAQIIFASAADMKIMIGAMLAGRREPKMMPSSLNQLVRQSFETVYMQSKYRDLQFDLQLDEGLPQVRMDPVQMQEVLMNLLANAADALGEADTRDPRVVIRTTLDAGGKTALLEVGDNGPGIPEDNLQKIFEPQFSTKGIRGHGFGLASVYNIVKQHGGRVTAQSILGQGATFRVAIPLYQAKN